MDKSMAHQDKSQQSRQPKQAAQAGKKTPPRQTLQTKKGKNGITSITIEGFKSISQKQSIEIRPLTILAGANSSGKSSIMQPLLLLKQTLNASYDPDPLMLNGPNIKFTIAEQVLSNIGAKRANKFSVGIAVDHDTEITTYFTKGEGTAFDIEQMTYISGDTLYRLYEGMESDEFLSGLRQGATEDTVSIADVGLGISQTLPVLVALHAANNGQLIYLEQPEIHLHPRA
jgi:predicted ATPase